MTAISKVRNLNKATIFLLIGIIILIAVGMWGFQKLLAKNNTPQQDLSDIDLSFDPEGPYALLYPRRDGNAIQLNIKRIASYDAFAYSLAYTDDGGISRGVGDENTWIKLENKKSEYEQEILFGTCSKNVCKYDKGVENGTLALRFKKGNQPYRLITQWHLQKPSLALGSLVSGDGHFSYKVASKSSDLTLLNFTIINDLSGAPKLPADKSVVGKVYSINAALSKDIPPGKVIIELSDTPSDSAKVAQYIEKDNNWKELDTKKNQGKLEAESPGGGIFAVFVTK